MDLQRVYTPLYAAAVLKELFTKKGSEDETIHDFVARRFGKEVSKVGYYI